MDQDSMFIIGGFLLLFDPLRQDVTVFRHLDMRHANCSVCVLMDNDSKWPTYSFKMTDQLTDRWKEQLKSSLHPIGKFIPKHAFINLITGCKRVGAANI